MAAKTRELEPYWYTARFVDGNGVSTETEGMCQAYEENDVYKMLLQMAVEKGAFIETQTIARQTIYTSDYISTIADPERLNEEEAQLLLPVLSTEAKESAREVKHIKEWYDDAAETILINPNRGKDVSSSVKDEFVLYLKQEQVL